MNYVLAFDQGTTSSRSIVFDRDGSVVSRVQKELVQIFPKLGWVEHDPLAIWHDQLQTACDSLTSASLTAVDISAIGITNQRETTIIWDRLTGEPIYNAIVWQDRRTAEFCDGIRSDHADTIRTKTGLEVDAYFSASKIAWLLNNVPDARSKAESGQLAFGTVDTWLVWKLTCGKVHITDFSNASRTMLFNINTLKWDAELLDIFSIPYMLLPAVVPSSEIYGETELSNEIADVGGEQVDGIGLEALGLR